jgi:hypothetical protein
VDTRGRGVERARWALGGLVFAAYLALTFRMDERYPFSAYAMFAHGGRWASEVLLRDASGTLRPVFDFEAFDCALEPRERYTYDPALGLDAALIPVEESALAFVLAHPLAPSPEPGAAGEPVELLRRLWVLDENERIAGPPRSFDLPVGHCTARPAGEGRGLLRLAWYFNR